MMTLIKKCFLEIARDIPNLFFMMAFPSLMVIVLGNALVGLDNPETPIESLTVDITVNTSDPAALAAIDSFIEEMTAYEEMDFMRTQDATGSFDRLNAGELDGYVVFDEPFALVVYEGLDSIKTSAIDIIFQGFSTRYGATMAVVTTNPHLLEQIGGQPTTSLVASTPAGFNRTMLDYYAVTMIVVIIVMGGSIGGASAVYAGRKDGTLAREAVSPRSCVMLYLHYLVGAVLQNIIQVGTLMLMSTLFFGAHYAATWDANLLLFTALFVAGMAVSAVFLFVGIFIKANPILIVMPLTWVLLFISGSFSKEIDIGLLGAYSPVSLVQNAAFDLTVFGNAQGCVLILLVSCVIVAVATALGVMSFNRKQVA